jgi:hypothetical protein
VSDMDSVDVVVIGAGLAGLCAARDPKTQDAHPQGLTEIVPTGHAVDHRDPPASGAWGVLDTMCR